MKNWCERFVQMHKQMLQTKALELTALSCRPFLAHRNKFSPHFPSLKIIHPTCTHRTLVLVTNAL